MKRRIYLDYNATAPVRSEVKTAVEPILFGVTEEGRFGNASSVHWAGQAARRELESARSQVAEMFGRKPSEVTFTSGGTESDNWAIDGLLAQTEKPRLIVSEVEHPAVMAAALRWSDRGAKVERVGVDAKGALRLCQLESLLKEPATLVSVMAVNNETGFIHDLEAVYALARASQTTLHVDAVQSPGRLPLAYLGQNADLLSLSGHKLGGLPGAGALIGRSDLGLDPALVGGPQERGRRAGTESVAAAVALALALRISEVERASETVRLGRLRDRLDEALANLPGSTIVQGAPRAAGVTSVVFEDVDGEVLLQALDLEGVAVSSGSACSSGSLEPSKVLLSLGFSPSLALSAVRFSLGAETTEEQIDRVIELMPALLKRARS